MKQNVTFLCEIYSHFDFHNYMFLIDKTYWEVKKTRKKGSGVFAKKEIKKGTVIGDYVGKLIDYKNVDYKAEKKDMYLMYYNDNFGIYPNLKRPGVHLINHSCSPNCWLYKFKDRTSVFALRNIWIGEEITINYLLPPKGDCANCPHKCYCKSFNCKGTMHLNEKSYQKWQEFQKSNWTTNKHVIKKSKLLPLKNYPVKITNDYINKLQRLKLTK